MRTEPLNPLDVMQLPEPDLRDFVKQLSTHYDEQIYYQPTIPAPVVAAMLWMMIKSRPEFALEQWNLHGLESREKQFQIH